MLFAAALLFVVHACQLLATHEFVAWQSWKTLGPPTLLPLMNYMCDKISTLSVSGSFCTKLVSSHLVPACVDAAVREQVATTFNV